jgi:hypothetical protein
VGLMITSPSLLLLYCCCCCCWEWLRWLWWLWLSDWIDSSIGHDGNNGTSPTFAFLTLDAAARALSGLSGCIFLKPGIYAGLSSGLSYSSSATLYIGYVEWIVSASNTQPISDTLMSCVVCCVLCVVCRVFVLIL